MKYIYIYIYITTLTRVYALFWDKSINFVKCTIISLFHYVFFLVLKLVIPPMSSILWRSEAFTPTCSYGECSKDIQWILGRAPMQTCDFSIIASRLLLDLQVGVGPFLRVCCVLLEHLSVWMLLGDCLCKITICLCFFCMYYFNVVHVFYVMNSPSCDTFYCIIILKAICLIP